MQPLPTNSGTAAYILQSRSKISPQKTNYTFLHDFARHVIHSTETLGVALDTVNRIIEQQEVLAANVNHRVNQEREAQPQTQQYLHFQLQMLKNLRARSEANQLRIQNEINFVRQNYLSFWGRD